MDINTLSQVVTVHGQAGVRLINQLISSGVLAKYLKSAGPLDIDATVIETDKSTATRTYKKCSGYTPMVGTIAETTSDCGAVAPRLRVGAPPTIWVSSSCAASCCRRVSCSSVCAVMPPAISTK